MNENKIFRTAGLNAGGILDYCPVLVRYFHLAMSASFILFRLRQKYFNTGKQ